MSDADQRGMVEHRSSIEIHAPASVVWQVLVDLRSDREETYDVSSLHPDVLADLTARLARARAKYAPFAVHVDAPTAATK